ncbi:MAG: hypothetical protein QOJ99_3036 [Bryobacterales bacterium]|nr:hypothetical protein [Bryobacterales bacterium]
MPAEPNIHLDDTLLAALEAAARRESKSVDEKAAELVMAGLDRKARMERIFEIGDEIRAQHPDTPAEADIPHTVRLMRRQRTLTR